MSFGSATRRLRYRASCVSCVSCVSSFTKAHVSVFDSVVNPFVVTTRPRRSSSSSLPNNCFSTRTSATSAPSRKDRRLRRWRPPAPLRWHKCDSGPSRTRTRRRRGSRSFVFPTFVRSHPRDADLVFPRLVSEILPERARLGSGSVSRGAPPRVARASGRRNSVTGAWHLKSAAGVRARGGTTARPPACASGARARWKTPRAPGSGRPRRRRRRGATNGASTRPGPGPRSARGPSPGTGKTCSVMPPRGDSRHAAGRTRVAQWPEPKRVGFLLLYPAPQEKQAVDFFHLKISLVCRCQLSVIVTVVPHTERSPCPVSRHRSPRRRRARASRLPLRAPPAETYARRRTATFSVRARVAVRGRAPPGRVRARRPERPRVLGGRHRADDPDRGGGPVSPVARRARDRGCPGARALVGEHRGFRGWRDGKRGGRLDAEKKKNANASTTDAASLLATPNERERVHERNEINTGTPVTQKIMTKAEREAAEARARARAFWPSPRRAPTRRCAPSRRRRRRCAGELGPAAFRCEDRGVHEQRVREEGGKEVLSALLLLAEENETRAGSSVVGRGAWTRALPPASCA